MPGRNLFDGLDGSKAFQAGWGFQAALFQRGLIWDSDGETIFVGTERAVAGK